MASFNKVILMGRLTHTPELKQTQGGKSVTSFGLAVDRSYVKEGEERQTDFFTVVAWRQTAEFICRYFEKGSAILVCGELQTRTFEQNGQRRTVVEVMASEVSFCETKKAQEAEHPKPTQSAPGGNFEAYTGGAHLPF